MLYGALFSEQAGQLFSSIQAFISDKFGFLLIILMNVALVFCVYLALSRYGDIRLGHQTEASQYSFGSWIGMLFSAGIGTLSKDWLDKLSSWSFVSGQMMV